MEAHNAMRNFERQNSGIIRVSHIWEYQVLSGNYYRITVRDPLTPEASDILSSMANDA